MNQPLASIHPNAIIHPSVIIEPFVTVGPNVEIGEGSHLYSSSTVMAGSRLGKNVNVFPGAVVGGIPQDLKFRGEDSLAVIGDNTTLRECVTVHRGTASKGVTTIGENCLIMAYSHVAHDCVIGNNVIMSNAVQAAGEVEIDDYAVVGGGTLIHQFTHIGQYVMIQGGTRLNKDIPPFAMVGHEPAAFSGINVIGLKRHGYSSQDIDIIQDVYRIIYNAGLNFSDALIRVEQEVPECLVCDQIIEFVRQSKRGIIRGGAR